VSFKTGLKTVSEKLRSTEPKSEFHSIRLTVGSLQIFKYYINQSFSKSTRIINYTVGTALLGMLGPWRSVAVINNYFTARRHNAASSDVSVIIFKLFVLRFFELVKSLLRLRHKLKTRVTLFPIDYIGSGPWNKATYRNEAMVFGGVQ